MPDIANKWKEPSLFLMELDAERLPLEEDPPIIDAEVVDGNEE